MEWESDSPCHSHTYLRQRRWSPGRRSSLELEFRDCGATPGPGMLLTVERQIKEMWGRRSWWEFPMEESQAATEARRTTWKRIQKMTVQMIKNLENKTEKKQESINKDLEELKKKHTETNNTITEIKNTREGINSRISEAEKRTSELEDKMVEMTSKSRIK